MLSYEPDDRPAAKDVSRACERLADRQAGATLARWVRERDWDQAEGEEPGELDGRQLVEGTLEDARPRGPMAPPTLDTLTEATTTTGGRVGLVMGGMSLVVLLGSVAVLGVAVVLVGLAVWQPWASEADLADVEPPETPEVVPSEPDPEPEPEPATPAPVEPAPSAPSPTPAPRARPAPEPEPVRVVVPRAPKPDPTPAPAPAPATSRVDASGAPARLVRGSEVLVLPADVPAGVWTVEAQFQGATWTPAKEGVWIAPGSTYQVRCGNWSCRVDGG
jgi:hypothetical protein